MAEVEVEATGRCSCLGGVEYTMRIRDIAEPNTFQELVHSVLVAEHGKGLQLVDDSSGDGGSDGYLPEEQTLFAIYCPEARPVTDKALQDKILSDVRKAAALRDTQGYDIVRWVFVTPMPLRPKVMKYLLDRVGKHGFIGASMSEVHLRDLLQKHGRVRALFPQLAMPQVAEQLAEISDKLDRLGEAPPPLMAYADMVCSPAPVALDAGRAGSAAMLVLAATTDVLASRTSGHLEQGLDAAREAWREGRVLDARAWVQQTRQDHQVWPHIDAATRAKIICFEASLALEVDEDIPRASALLSESEAVAATPNALRLRAFIAYREHGRDAAMAVLESCDDAGCRNMRAALLIELGRTAEALSLLDSAHADAPRVLSVEAHRLRAIALLILGRIDEAVAEIGEALLLAPRWRDIQLCAAQVEYFSALTDTVALDRRPTWPDPVDPALVKRDQQSVRLLRSAQDRLRRMGASTHEGQGSDEVNAWLLACLAVDADRQPEAVDQCRSMLDQSPANFVAIAWAMRYGWDVDMSRSEGALLVLIDGAEAQPPHVAALLDYFLHHRRTADALGLLDRVSPLLGAGEDGAPLLMLTIWRSQALAADGRYAEALSVLDGADEHPILSDVRTSILRADAVASGNWDRLAAHLRSLVEKQGEPHTILQLGQLMAHLHCWQEVAALADRLVAAMPTPAAIELAATGLAYAGECGRSLDVLDRYSSAFPDGALSTHARRIRAWCLHTVGRHMEAKAEAERLVMVEDAPVEDLLLLARLYSDTLDIRRLAGLASRLLKYDDLPAREALMIAGVLKGDDLSVSQSLWHKALQAGVPDELTGMAIGLGFDLGLDSEVAPLFQRAMQIGDEAEGGLRTLDFPDAVEMVTAYRRQAEELFSRYQRGELPIHLIAAQENLSLAQLYRSMLLDNEAEPDPLRRPVLFTRHGGRRSDEGSAPDAATWRLHADITALLLAEHLGLLPSVEGHFSPILIPEEVVPALYRMRDKAQPHQPSQLAALQEIDRLVVARRLHIAEGGGDAAWGDEAIDVDLPDGVEGRVAQALANGGLAIEFVPLRSNAGEPIPMPSYAEGVLVSCRAVVDALLVRGHVTQDEHAGILARLGAEALDKGERAAVGDGVPLFASLAIVKLLASSGALAALCRHHPVHISGVEYEAIRLELAAHGQREELEGWVVGLMDRIRNGLDAGIYVKAAGPKVPDGKGEDLLERSPDVGCLTTLIGSDASADAVLWVDDRCANGARCSRPVVDVTDVIQALADAGALTADQQFAMLHKMRAGNVRFLPLVADEIVQYICHSRVQHGTLIPSRELAVLTRHLAATLARCQELRFAPLAPDQHGPELAYLMSVPRVLEDVLVKLWIRCADQEEDRIIRMEWFLRYLYVDHAGIAALMGIERGDEAKRHAVGIAFGALFMHGLMWEMDPAGEWRRQRSLLNQWADERLLAPAVEADAEVLPLAAKALAAMLKPTIEESIAGTHHEVARGVTAMFFDDLPASLKEELAQDNGLMAFIGATCFSSVTVGGLTFDADAYWRAVRLALDGQTATIAPLNADGVLTLGPARTADGITVVPIFHPDGMRRGMIHLPAPGLLSDDPIVREKALRDLPAWFDGDTTYREQAIASIAASDGVSHRMCEAEKCRLSSMTVRYADLSSSEAVGVDDIRVPSASSVLRYLRLAEDAGVRCSFAEALADSAASLMVEAGVFGAMERLIGMPVALPNVLLEAASSLGADGRRGLIRFLLTQADSPISRMHTVHLLMVWSDDSPAYSRLARRMVRHLLSDAGKQEVEAFKAVIGWTCSDFERWPEVRSWSTAARMAAIWSHAHRIYARFSAGMSDPRGLAAWMERTGEHRLANILTTRSPGYRQDVAHPNRLRYAKLMVSGLAYACGDAGRGWLGDDILDGLLAIAVTQTENGPFISAPLLADTLQAPDSMGSLLGGDPGTALDVLFGPEVAALGSHVRLRELADSATAALQASWDISLAWITLAGVLGDLPPYTETAPALAEAIRGIAIAVLPQDNPQAPAFILRFAAGMAYHIDDRETRMHLREQLLVATRLYSAAQQSAGSTRDQRAAMEEACGWLLEAALHLALAEGEPPKVAVAFADLIREISDAWPLAAKVVLPVVHDCCRTLPATVANPFWPLLVRLRAV